jgi:hypothetical protein
MFAALNAVFQLCFTGLARAMDTAEDLSVRFNAVSHNCAVAMWANRRQRVYRAFETVKRVVFSVDDYFKRLVIFIFTNFAFSHT